MNHSYRTDQRNLLRISRILWLAVTMLLFSGLPLASTQAKTSSPAKAASSEVSLVVKIPATMGRLHAQDVDIKLFARRLEKGRMTDQEIPLKVLSVQPIRHMATGRASAFKVQVQLPAGVTQEHYALLAYIDAGNTVAQTNAGQVDLAVTFDRVTLPRRIVSGGKGVARFVVKITNKGDIATRRKQRVDVKIIARPADRMDDSKDITLTVASNEPIGELEPQESHKLVLIAEFPGQLEVQSYKILVKVTPQGAMTDRDQANNLDQLPDTVAITGRHVDLLCDIDKVQLPKGIVAGSTKKLIVPVKLSNAGNLGFDLDQSVDIRVVARPATSIGDASNDVLLALQQGIPLSDLAPGKSMVIPVAATLPATLAQGTYTLRVAIDTANRIKEANEHNNTAMLLEPISVLAKVVDLQGELMNARAPQRVIAGQTPRLVMPLRITNSGSVPFNVNTPPIDIKLVARPADALDTQSDIVLKWIKSRPITGLHPKQSFILNLDTNLPANMPPNRYKLMAIVDAAGVIAEADQTNNTPTYKHILAVEKPFVDLAAGIITLRPAHAIVSGSNHQLTVPIKVTNRGNVPPPASQRLAISVSARPLANPHSSSNDVPLATLSNLDLSDLLPGTTRLFQARASFPPRIPAGKYLLVAKVDAQAQINEPDEENNIAVAPVAHAIQIAAPRVDVAAQLVNVDLPRAVIAGQGRTLDLPIKVINQGNVPLPSDQYLDIKVSARPLGTDGEGDLDLALLIDQPVMSLAPRASRTFHASVRIPKNVAAGKYLLAVHLDATDKLHEQDESNNHIATAPSQAFEVVAPQIDLVANLVDPLLPDAMVAGQGPEAILPIVITNAGNVPTAKNQAIDLKIYARPAQGGKPILINTLTHQAIGDLAPGQTTRIVASAQLPAGTPHGRYILMVRIDTSHVVAETDEKNNEVRTAVASAIAVAEPFVDLAAGFGKVALPDSLIAGHSPPITLPLIITNMGNVATAPSAKISADIFCATEGKTSSMLAHLSKIEVGSLKAGDQKTIPVSVRLPATLGAGRYVLGVQLTGTQQVADTQRKNDTARMVQAVAVVRPFVDLALGIDPVRLPEQAIAGHSNTIQLPVAIFNKGNIPVGAHQQINLRIHAQRIGHDATRVAIGAMNGVSVASLAPGEAVRLRVPAKLPSSLAQGKYILSVRLDPTSLQTDTDLANNHAATAASHAITVVQPYLDIVPRLVSRSLPQSVIGGYGPSFTLQVRIANLGNVSIPPQQKLAMTVEAIGTHNPMPIKITTQSNIEISGLAPGLSTQAKIPVLLPASLEAGAYRLRLRVGTLNQLPEKSNQNNVLTVQQTINVIKPFVDLEAGIENPSLPATVVAGVGPAIAVRALVRNCGNVPTRPNQKVNVQLLAQTGKNKPVVLATATGVDLGGLGPASVRAVDLHKVLGADMAAGSYRIGVRVQPLEALTEPRHDNNQFMLSPENAIQLERPFIDLQAQFEGSNLPRKIVAGHSRPTRIAISLTNGGNVSVPDQSHIQMRLFARAIDRTAQDIVLATLTDQDISNLAPGGVAGFETTVQFPSTMAVGYYVVGLAIDTNNQIRESNESNNQILTDKGMAMAVDRPRIDLFATLETVRATGGIILDAQKVSVYLKVGNRGNIPLPAKQTMDVMLYARPVSLGKLSAMDLKLGRMANLDVGSLGPGQVRTFRHEVLFSTSRMPTDDYFLVAHVDSSNLIRETDEKNNDASAPDRVIALGRRFRIRGLPVPFDSDGPRRYKVNTVAFVFRGTGKAPPMKQLPALEIKLTRSYAGLVAPRYGEPAQRMTLKEVAQLKNVYLYRSAVRVLCARIADHLHNLTDRTFVVRPAPEQIGRQGEDLRPPGKHNLTLVIETPSQP